MASPDPVLPETGERQCPACQSEKIVHAGYVVGGGGLIRSEQRCEACGTAFWFARKRVPGMPPPPWDEGGLSGGSSSGP
jgi:predicted Zn-ribbon and HTH transcriptional regulator